jgi:hypothetical protein
VSRCCWFSATPALAQSSWQQQKCDKGQMPTPNGCMQVCPPGSAIGKDASGFQTCLRDGNTTVREAIVGTGALNATRQKKYAFLPIAAGNDVDGICFGIRSDERVETVNDDRFVDSACASAPCLCCGDQLHSRSRPHQAPPHRLSVLAP